MPRPPTSPKSKAPEPPAPRTPAWRAAGRLLHRLARAGWALFVALICAVLYLWLVGLPSFIVERALARVEPDPFTLSVRRVSLDPTEGLVGTDVRLFRAPDVDEPVARIDRVVLHPGWGATWRSGPRLRGFSVAGGTTRIVVGAATNAAQPPATVLVTGIAARVRLDAEHIAVQDLQAGLFGTLVTGTGTVERLPPEAARQRDIWRDVASLLDLLRQVPVAVPDVVGELNRMRFDPPARARVAFHLDPAQPAAQDVAVRLDAQGALIRGAEFDAVRAELHIRGADLELAEATFSVGARRCHLAGRLNLATRMVESRLYSDLPPQQWIAMVPLTWQEHLRAAGIEIAGSLRSELWTGPVRLEDAANALGGWVSIEQGSVRGAWLERAYVAVRVTSNAVHFTDLTAEVGRGRGRGPLEGRVVWQRDTGLVQADVQAEFDPRELLPLATPRQATALRRFTFPGPMPRFEGRLSCVAQTNPHITVEGRVSATNWQYRGVDIASMSATVFHSNEVLTLRPWVFSRPEGATTGWLSMDFKTDLYTADLESTVHPHAIAGLVGPRLHRLLSTWQFDGPTRLVARGVVDGDDVDGRTDLWLDAEGRAAGRDTWRADTFAFRLHALHGQYVTTNAQGTAYGGTFTAVVEVPPGSGTNRFFTLVAALTNAEMGAIAAARRPGSESNLTGLVSGNVALRGLVEDAGGRGTTGRGELRVQDGNLFRLPLLGGLSSLLSMIYPGLGFASQTDLHSTFEVQDRAITTEDARLEGDILSIRAGGRYEIGGRMRFVVEVQLLRRGPVAAVLRLVTLPVTKLLEFQLSGTPEDPKWRPVNLPKELFLIFE